MKLIVKEFMYRKIVTSQLVTLLKIYSLTDVPQGIRLFSRTAVPDFGVSTAVTLIRSKWCKSNFEP